MTCITGTSATPRKKRRLSANESNFRSWPNRRTPRSGCVHRADLWNRPSLVRNRKCSFRSASRIATHVAGSSPNNRWACDGVNRRLGMSRYSSRTRCRSSSSGEGRADVPMRSLIPGGRALMRPCAGAGERPARGRQSQESVESERYTFPASGTSEYKIGLCVSLKFGRVGADPTRPNADRFGEAFHRPASTLPSLWRSRNPTISSMLQT